MSDLVAFLRARLDEDEAEAWRQPALDRRPTYEVEADRALLAAYEAAAGNTGGSWEGDEAPYADGLEAGLLAAVKIRAAIHRDHPDYDPAWGK